MVFHRSLWLLAMILALATAGEARAQGGIDASGQVFFSIPFGGDGRGPGPINFGLRIGPSEDGSIGAASASDPLEGFVLEFDELGSGRVALGWFAWTWDPRPVPDWKRFQALPPSTSTPWDEPPQAGSLLGARSESDEPPRRAGTRTSGAESALTFTLPAVDGLLGDLIGGLRITPPRPEGTNPAKP